MTAITFPGAAISDSRRDVVPLYVWELPVRVTHWLIVLSIAVLATTGIYIGHPFITVTGEAREHFLMGWMRAIHFYTSIVFTLAVLSRVVWFFMGNRFASWKELVPVTRRRWRGIWATLRFYIVHPREPLGFVGHNPLAGVVYILVFAAYFVMIASGFALYSAYANVTSYMRVFQFLIPVFGGLQLARYWHHITMWVLIAFMVQHVYSALLMTIVERNATLASIFTGFKFVPRETAEAPDAES